jgi:hypothetical protein
VLELVQQQQYLDEIENVDEGWPWAHNMLSLRCYWIIQIHVYSVIFLEKDTLDKISDIINLGVIMQNHVSVNEHPWSACKECPEKLI